MENRGLAAGFQWTSDVSNVFDHYRHHVPPSLLAHPISPPKPNLMASTETETAVVPQRQQVVKKQKKLKPARKQVAPGQVEKKEAPQTGKEYSTFSASHQTSPKIVC